MSCWIDTLYIILYRPNTQLKKGNRSVIYRLRAILILTKIEKI